MLTLFKAIESVKMGLKRVKKKIGGEKIGPRLGKKIDRLEVYTSPVTAEIFLVKQMSYEQILHGQMSL